MSSPSTITSPSYASESSHINIRPQNGDIEMSGDRPGRTLIDPFGKPLTIDRLPPANTVRWVVRRKVQVVCAIREGLISQREACDRYDISDAELLSWEKLLNDDGPKALRVTSIQRDRQPATSTDEDAPSGSAAQASSNGLPERSDIQGRRSKYGEACPTPADKPRRLG